MNVTYQLKTTLVAYCNQTNWQWWSWKINDDGSMGPQEVFAHQPEEMKGQVGGLKELSIYETYTYIYFYN